MEKCSLTATMFAKVVQAVLAVLCFGSLIVKRHIEHPKRKFRVWVMDTTKQVASSGCAHLSGMAIATLIEAATAAANECAWYFLTFTLDTTLGVSLAYLLLRLQDAVVVRYDLVCLGKSGYYGDHPHYDYGLWIKQLIVWCIITVFVRMCVGMLMYAAKDPLSSLASLVATPFEGHAKLFLVLVMIGCPLCMNIAQLWVQDTFLKKKQQGGDDTQDETVVTPRDSEDNSTMYTRLVTPEDDTTSLCDERGQCTAHGTNGKP
jgi:hypothetical protein